MDMFKAPHVDKIVLCCGTQLGKSESVYNMMGYAIDQDPGTMLLVLPSDELARSISKNRLQLMIIATKVLLEKWDRTHSETQELQFLGMYIALVGANSPAKLASRPVRYVFYDETDKFPMFSGKEAKPTELASERTKNFLNRKEVHVSSPTLSTGHIWSEFLNAEVRKRYFVPCPKCGFYQTLKLPQIKWPEELNERKDERLSRVLAESWYECEHCHAKIRDMDKFGMLSGGEWRAVEQDDEKRWRVSQRISYHPRSVAYNISSLYSPWVTFGQVAQKFLMSKGDPAKLMNFVNGWLGEPWENEALRLRSDIVLERQSTHLRGVVPEKAQLLTCGIDVQRGCYWWVVRAWGPKLTSWLVDFGRVETEGELDEMLDKEWPQMGQEPLQIHLAFMDSGDQTDEVYEYCSKHTGIVFPCKGSSSRMARAPIAESKVEHDDFGGMRLFIIDGHYYKNFIAGRLKRETDSPGSFNVYNSEDEATWLHAYAEQLCAEQLVTEIDSRGRQSQVWRPITTHAWNHLLDAECYAIAAAERANVRYLREEEDQ
jgi:phage terminase large subunit GpA-like protein